MNNGPLLVAIVGGSGSGKSWLAEQLAGALEGLAVRLCLDDFYRDQSHVPELERGAINFDHPDAIDWPALEAVLTDLSNGRPAQLPCYDFKTHCRGRSTTVLQPKPVVLVEGLWLLHRPTLRALFDLKLFIDCPSATRLRRRVDRDIATRGRTRASVEKQFAATVEPMHREFVTPQKRYADVVLPYDLTDHDARELARRLASRLVPAVAPFGVQP
jgi:uridine kinase